MSALATEPTRPAISPAMPAASVRTELQAMADLDALTDLWMMTTSPVTRTVTVSATGKNGPVTVQGRTRRDVLNAILYELRNGPGSAEAGETA